MGDRHSIRADWSDYNKGYFFITICTNNKVHSFGHIREGKMYLSRFGEIVETVILDIPNHHSDVDLINHVVMPNHLHMILGIDDPLLDNISPDKTINTGCLKPPRHGTPCINDHFRSKLSIIVGTFKSACTRNINKIRSKENPTLNIEQLPKIWQRNYHEHIIRNQRSFENIMHYIDHNVENWESDCYC